MAGLAAGAFFTLVTFLPVRFGRGLDAFAVWFAAFLTRVVGIRRAPCFATLVGGRRFACGLLASEDLRTVLWFAGLAVVAVAAATAGVFAAKPTDRITVARNLGTERADHGANAATCATAEINKNKTSLFLLTVIRVRRPATLAGKRP